MDETREYRYFSVEELPRPKGRKTNQYYIKNTRSGDCLGEIAWYAPWRQFCFFPVVFTKTIWSPDCLRDIEDAIKWAEQHRKEADGA